MSPDEPIDFGPRSYGEPEDPNLYETPPPYVLAPPTDYGAGPYGAAPAMGYPNQPWDAAPAPDPRRSRRRILIAVAAGVLVLFVVIGGAAYIASKDDSGTTAANVNVPPGPGVVYVSKEGHFADRFPEEPDTRTIPESIGNVKISVRVAAVGDQHVFVEAVEYSEPLPSSQSTAVLHSAIASFGSAIDYQAESQTDTTLQGKVAYQGTYRSDAGDELTAIAMVYSDTRFYLIAAPSGDTYNDLIASFVAIP